MDESDFHLFNGRLNVIRDESVFASLLIEKDTALAPIDLKDDIETNNCNNIGNSEYFVNLTQTAYKYNSNVIIYSAVSEGNELMKFFFNSNSSNSISTNI